MPKEPGQVAEAELRGRLRDCVATRGLAGGGLTVIEGGLSNRAWRLEAAGTAWFVRLGHEGARRALGFGAGNILADDLLNPPEATPIASAKLLAPTLDPWTHLSR